VLTVGTAGGGGGGGGACAGSKADVVVPEPTASGGTRSRFCESSLVLCCRIWGGALVYCRTVGVGAGGHTSTRCWGRLLKCKFW